MEYFNTIDINQDGKISYEEFEQVLYDCYEEPAENNQDQENGEAEQGEITMELLTQIRVLYQEESKNGVLNLLQARSLLGKLGSRYPISADEFNLFFGDQETISEG